MTSLVHYYYSRERKQLERKTGAHYTPSALCGHGKPIMQLKSTSNIDQVTCPLCLDKIKQCPLYEAIIHYFGG